jgi:hypothetical protein
MSSPLATTESAITGRTGEGPRANAIRNAAPIGNIVSLVSPTPQPISPVNALQSREGLTPLSDTLASMGRYGVNHGVKARFAGQEGETPLNQYIRSL